MRYNRVTRQRQWDGEVVTDAQLPAIEARERLDAVSLTAKARLERADPDSAWVDLLVPCKQCPPCRKRLTFERSVVIERDVEVLLRLNPEAEAVALNLTYAPEYLPPYGSTRYLDHVDLSMRIRTRIKDHAGGLQQIREPGGFKSDYRWFGCHEYGSGTGRAHMHLLLVVPKALFEDRLPTSPSRKGNPQWVSGAAAKLWPYGDHTIGECDIKSIRYIAGYLQEKLHPTSMANSQLPLADQHLVDEFVIRQRWHQKFTTREGRKALKSLGLSLPDVQKRQKSHRERKRRAEIQDEHVPDANGVFMKRFDAQNARHQFMLRSNPKVVAAREWGRAALDEYGAREWFGCEVQFQAGKAKTAYNRTRPVADFDTRSCRIRTSAGDTYPVPSSVIQRLLRGLTPHDCPLIWGEDPEGLVPELRRIADESIVIGPPKYLENGCNPHSWKSPQGRRNLEFAALLVPLLVEETQEHKRQQQESSGRDVVRQLAFEREVQAHKDARDPTPPEGRRGGGEGSDQATRGASRMGTGAVAEVLQERRGRKLVAKRSEIMATEKWMKRQLLREFQPRELSDPDSPVSALDRTGRMPEYKAAEARRAGKENR